MTLPITVLAAVCAGLSATFAAWVIIDVINEISARYRERFVREAGTDLDDVLSELPPEKVLSYSVMLAVFAAVLVVLILYVNAPREAYNPDTGLIEGGVSYLKMLVFSLAAAIIAFFIPRFYLRYKKQQRLIKFNEQLVDALNSISSALKAGFSINQAIDTIVEERIKPISDEFAILTKETRLGVSLEEALEKMNKRLKSEDFELVAAAIVTARQTGGELTVVLERLAAMVRERIRINGRIRALTAQGRLQARIIGAMPYLLLLSMAYIAPEITGKFYNSPLGIMVLIGVSILVLIGFLCIRKITNIDV